MCNGKAMDLRKGRGWETTRAGETSQWSYSLQLYYYCEEMDLCNEVYEKLVDIDVGLLRASCFWHLRVFFLALVAIENTKLKVKSKRNWKHDAKRYVNMIRIWVTKHQAINMAHRLLILEAFQKNHASERELVTCFDAAIARSAKAGFQQDAALAAAIAVRLVQDETNKLAYARRARELFTSWGALGVVEYLASTTHIYSKSEKFTRPSLIVRAMSRQTVNRARARFDDCIPAQHREISGEF
mmetsp:Transcript_19380/g.32185  ORF Transcript_19380/g.32185 Transcript_19380/m.32185 type:complete len:242 (+) Transcript_19380:171-896(+)